MVTSTVRIIFLLALASFAGVNAIAQTSATPTTSLQLRFATIPVSHPPT